MDIKTIPIEEVRPNPNNPRKISDKKMKDLVRSLKEFPEMLKVRPLVLDEDGTVLGGNMRLNALKQLNYKKVPVLYAKDWSEEQKREFIVKDNLAFGDWDWDALILGWDVSKLLDWSLNVPPIKNTELLSGLEYKGIYYEPELKPDIKLSDCVDLEKFNKKIEAIEALDLTKKQKETLKLFAYRFIKIDFEQVANYYSFNATENEKLAIERLRLVLIDDGVKGFIQDDLLKILNFTDEIKEND